MVSELDCYNFQNLTFLVYILFSASAMSGNNLDFLKVNREHMGRYICIAVNGLEPMDMRVTDLKVLCKHFKMYLLL